MPELRANISVTDGSEDDRRGVIKAIKAHALMGRASATTVDFPGLSDDTPDRLVVRVTTEEGPVTGAHVDRIELACRRANESATLYGLATRATLDAVDPDPRRSAN